MNRFHIDRVSHSDRHESNAPGPGKPLTVDTLRTPPVEILPAPLLRRVAAAIFDAAVTGLFWGFLVFGTGFFFKVIIFLKSASPALDEGSLAAPALVYFTAGLVYVSFAFLYFLLLEGFLGASLGKRLFRLMVVDRDGDPCSLKASFSRNFLRFVDWLPFLYIFGVIAILASAKRQRIGDRFAGTLVARAPAKDINPPPAPFLFH